jgi:hypothetical protein
MGGFMLNSTYVATDSRTSLRANALFRTGCDGALPVVGAYNQGLFTVVDESVGETLLARWSWLVGDQCLALMTTGFGDVFFWRSKEGVYYLDAQRAEIEFVGAETGWLTGGLLADPLIVDQVLRLTYFEELVRTHRPLHYGEIFILEPWLMLGGRDEPQNYGIGQCSVYLELVGQIHLQSR